MNYSCNYRPASVPDLDHVYTLKGLENVRPRKYNYYSEIKGGYIDYYPNRRPIEDVFSAPVFSNNSAVVFRPYVDPMGSFKPEYTRNETRNNNKYMLTFLQDTNEQREEIIGLQLRKTNKNIFDGKVNQ
jgi:hypothetical protein